MSSDPPTDQISHLQTTIRKVLDSLDQHDLAEDSPNPDLPTSPSSLASYIDHTYLKLDVTDSIIRTLCAEAQRYNFKAVCVRPEWVSLCASLLINTPIQIASVVDFHHGTASPSDKANEAASAVQDGAHELDLVIDYPALKAGDHATVFHGIREVRDAADAFTAEKGKTEKVVLKCILETSQLGREDIVAACVSAEEAGADFVKTSTGFNGAGASVENVSLMRRVVGDRLGVKASGGVRSVEDCLRMIEAGASRVGMSNGVGVMEEFANAGKGGAG